MSVKKVVLILLGVALVSVGAVLLKESKQSESPEETTFCTMDAMQCPDGSWIGRTGPNCEFVCLGE